MMKMGANKMKQTEELVMKIKEVLMILELTLIIGLFAAPALTQDEEPGSQMQDTPYFSGMPNYKIIDAFDREFADFRFYNGKDCTTMEGKRSHRAYTLKEDAEPASELQIARNYANAVKEMGGTVVFEGICEGADCEIG